MGPDVSIMTRLNEHYTLVKTHVPPSMGDIATIIQRSELVGPSAVLSKFDPTKIVFAYGINLGVYCLYQRRGHVVQDVPNLRNETINSTQEEQK